MASQNAGTVTWNLDLNSGKFESKLASSRSEISGFQRTLQSVEGGVASFAQSLAGIAWTGLKVGVGAAATAMVGLGAKGITSANQLQSLQLSMNGLTHSMDLGAQAMAGAYEFAQKAPFQLPEVAGATKTLIAYGQNVQQAVGSLETLGNVSITTGVPLGHLAGIFGQVSAQGKLMLGDIRQLTENGVAILPALQQQLGKTAQEVQDMASAGEISFGQFNQALQSLVDPSILDQLSNTLPRQIDRLNGSVRQLSNAFVGVSVDATNGFTMMGNGIAQATTNLVKNLADQLRSTEIKAAFADIGLQVVPVINQVSALLQPLVGTVIAIAQPLATFLTAIVGGLLTLLTSSLPGITTFFQALNTGFQPLIPILAQFGSILGGSISTALTALAPAVQPLVQAFGILAPELATIVGLVAAFAAGLISALAPVLPVIAKLLVGIVQPLINGLEPILPDIVNFVAALAGAFSQVVTALLPLLPPIITLATSIIQQILLPLMPQIVKLVQLFANVITMVLTAITPLLPPIVRLVGVFVTALAPIMPTLVDLFIQLVTAMIPLLPPLLQLVTILLPPLIQLLTLTVQVVAMLSDVMITVLVGAISAVITVAGVLIASISQVYLWFGSLAQRVSTAASQMLNSVISKVSEISDWFAQLPLLIVRSIGDLGSVLYNSGRSLITGLLNGAGSLLGSIGNFFLSKLPDWIRDPFKQALGIHSPSTVFAGFGTNLVEGLARGVTSSQGVIQAAMSGLSDQVALDTTMDIGTSHNGSGAVIAPALAARTTAPAAAGQSPVVVHFNPNGMYASSRAEWREMFKDGVEAINEELRARRLPEIAGGAVSGSSTAV